MAEVTDTAPSAPRSPAELFLAFNRLALQGFGGVLPVAQRELVERLRWLSREQFLQLLSLSQVLPGPNIINLGLILGDRAFGWRGALAAMAGLMLAPLAIVLALALAATHWREVPEIAAMLRGMGVVAAGLVLSTVAKLAPALRRSVLGLPVASALVVITAAAIGWLRLPLVAVVLGLGGAAVAWAWLRSGR
jgi:chromate transporter